MNKILQYFMVCVGKLHYIGNKCVGVDVIFSPTYNQEQVESVYISIDGLKFTIPEIYLDPSNAETIKREFQSVKNFQDLLIAYIKSILK